MKGTLWLESCCKSPQLVQGKQQLTIHKRMVGSVAYIGEIKKRAYRVLVRKPAARKGPLGDPEFDGREFL
jgi:hypothetical protein